MIGLRSDAEWLEEIDPMIEIGARTLTEVNVNTGRHRGGRPRRREARSILSM